MKKIMNTETGGPECATSLDHRTEREHQLPRSVTESDAYLLRTPAVSDAVDWIRETLVKRPLDWRDYITGILSFHKLHEGSGLGAEALGCALKVMGSEVFSMLEREEVLEPPCSGIIIEALEDYKIEPIFFTWMDYAFHCDLLDFLGVDVGELVDEPSTISAGTCQKIADLAGRLARGEIKILLPHYFCRTYGKGRDFCVDTKRVKQFESLQAKWLGFSNQGGAVKRANPLESQLEEVMYYRSWHRERAHREGSKISAI